MHMHVVYCIYLQRNLSFIFVCFPNLQTYYEKEAERGFNLDNLLMQFKDTIEYIQWAFKSSDKDDQCLHLKEDVEEKGWIRLERIQETT